MHLHKGTGKIKWTYCDETKNSVIDSRILRKLYLSSGGPSIRYQPAGKGFMAGS